MILHEIKQDMPLVDDALQTYGTVTYGSYKYSFPIPDDEMGANGNMKQNQGLLTSKP